MNFTSNDDQSITYTPAFLVMQVFFAASMFIGCLLSYLGPIWYFEKITQRSRTSTISAENVIAYCNCFGAGIFVAICFLGMLPVVQQEFHLYFQSRGIDHVDYPVAELFSLIGFFLVLFLEEMVHFFRNRSQGDLQPVLYLDDVSMESDSNHSLLAQERTPGAMSADDFEELKLEEPEVRTIRPKSHIHNDHMSHVHSHSHLPPSTSNTFTFFVLMFATRYVFLLMLIIFLCSGNNNLIQTTPLLSLPPQHPFNLRRFGSRSNKRQISCNSLVHWNNITRMHCSSSSWIEFCQNGSKSIPRPRIFQR